MFDDFVFLCAVKHLSNICRTSVKQKYNIMEFSPRYNYKNKMLDPGIKLEVKIACYFNRKYRYIDTGIFIEPRFWDDAKNAISAKHPSAKVINILISQKINDLNNAAYDCERAGGVFDFDALDRFCGTGAGLLFSQYIKNEMQGETFEMLTIQKYKRNIDIMCNLLPDMDIKRISPEHVVKFDAALRAQFSNSTVARINVFINKYLKRAVKQGKIKFNPYDRVSINTDRGKSEAEHLSIDEIKAIEAMVCINPSLELTRDRFLYSCYTGLRISDNRALLKSMVTHTDAGLVVQLHTIKGYGHDLVHPLRLMFDGKPERIAQKWIDKSPGPYVFPVQSDTLIGSNLRTIAAVCKVDKRVTFHTARHTCATMLAEVTQNPFLMLNIMGWTDVRIAMNYIHRSFESTARQLKVYKDNWI